MLKPIIYRYTLPGWFPYLAFAWHPFIFVRTGERLIWAQENHERIHHAQQVELGKVLYTVLYIFYFCSGMFWHFLDKDKAYMDIPFEREAYANQSNRTYLDTRPAHAWTEYRGH